MAAAWLGFGYVGGSLRFLAGVKHPLRNDRMKPNISVYNLRPQQHAKKVRGSMHTAHFFKL